MTRILGKDDLLSGNLLRRQLVEVPEWGASLYLREMSGEHILEFKRRTEAMRADGVKNTTTEQDVELATLVISFSVCDEAGELLLTQDDAKKLTVNNLNVLMDLFNKVCEISGIEIDMGGQMQSEVSSDLPNEIMKSSSES
jgi:hypothetical protein